METTDLRREIEEAFGDLPKPEITLRVAQAMDYYCEPETPEELQRLRDQDNYEQWQEIPDSDLEKYCEAIYFLDSAAYKYYLPAFMLYCINNPDTDYPIDYRLRATIRSRLVEGDPPVELTTTQRQAVRSFLDYMTAHAEDPIIAQRTKKLAWELTPENERDSEPPPVPERETGCLVVLLISFAGVLFTAEGFRLMLSWM